MPRLIDADKLRGRAKPIIIDGWPSSYSVSVFDIDNAPTVDAEPVRHGTWIRMSEPDDADNAEFECSLCRYRDSHAMSCSVPHCWYCGAKMDAGDVMKK